MSSNPHGTVANGAERPQTRPFSIRLTDAERCLLLDRARLEANCARMRAAVARHGVRLRPHVKTAKCVEVAEAALGDAPFRGLTVSTLAEARRRRDHRAGATACRDSVAIRFGAFFGLRAN